MSMHSIFLPLAFEETAGSITKAALILAKKLHGHVLGHHIRQSYAGYPPADFFVPVGDAATVFAQEGHDEATAAFARTLRASFEEQCDQNDANIVPVSEALKQNGVTASWMETVGLVFIDYSLAARVADLVVMANPYTRKLFLERDIFEAVLFQSGAPILALPEQGITTFPKRPIVAWDGSLQAARVVRAAMPFLQESEETTLITIGEADAGCPSIEAAAHWLERSNVRVTIKSISKFVGSVADRLVEEAGTANCDLMVLGGYSHSRLHEAVIGGVTRQILHNAQLPLLMAH